MEKRHCSRTSLQLPTTLELSNTLPIAGMIRDISPSGVYIETRSLLRFLPVYTALEVSFVMPGSLMRDAFRFQAIITRRDTKGVGLMFLYKDAASSKSLSKALSHPLPMPRGRTHSIGNMIRLN